MYLAVTLMDIAFIDCINPDTYDVDLINVAKLRRMYDKFQKFKKLFEEDVTNEPHPALHRDHTVSNFFVDFIRKSYNSTTSSHVTEDSSGTSTPHSQHHHKDPYNFTHLSPMRSVREYLLGALVFSDEVIAENDVLKEQSNLNALLAGEIFPQFHANTSSLQKLLFTREPISTEKTTLSTQEMNTLLR